jgi:HEAT repeat protein
VMQMIEQRASRTANASSSSAPAATDELQAQALWIEPLCRMLNSSLWESSHRAGQMLIESFGSSDASPAVRAAWRKGVPSLVRAITSADPTVRHGTLTILSLLGPEAGDALASVQSLMSSTQDGGLRSAAHGVLKSISCGSELTDNDPALRVAASKTVAGLGWRASSALPALFNNLSAPDPTVRIAAIDALGALGKVSETAVQPLASALRAETDAAIRAAIVRALEAIAPGTPSVLDAHLIALRDPDPAVRAAGAGFTKVPSDDAVVSALVTALGDPSEDVRQKVASSLTEILFESSAVAPAILNALRDSIQRKAVVEALGKQLTNARASADFRRVRTAALSGVIRALSEALSLDDEGIRLVVYRALGRIVAFSRLSDDENIRKAIEPAFPVYLGGLDEKDPAIRAELLSSLRWVTFHREDTTASLNKFLERPDLFDDERQKALVALKALTAAPGAADASQASDSPSPPSGRMRFRD